METQLKIKLNSQKGRREKKQKAPIHLFTPNVTSKVGTRVTLKLGEIYQGLTNG